MVFIKSIVGDKMMYLLAEFQKIKRNNTIFIVIVATFFINLMSVFQTNYDGTFSLREYADVLLWNHSCFLYPVMITLICGYLIDLEYKNNTLKNIYLAAINSRTLICAKLFVGFCFLLIIAILEFICSTIGVICCHIEVSGESVGYFFVQQIVFAVCSFISVLPIIILGSQKENGYLFGSLVAAFLEICGIFLAPRGLCGYYAITAGLEILNFNGGMVGGTLFSGSQGEVTLVITIGLSVLLLYILCPKNRDYMIEK